jgi:hypothetical protein
MKMKILNDEYLKNKIKQLEKLENKKFPILNIFKINKLKTQIQAIEEGQRRDVLVPSVTGVDSSEDNIDKNNYATYSSQVEAINKMYNNETDYGGEFLRPLIDTRISFIGGAGISILMTREDEIGKKIEVWINEFLNYNKYRGSRLIEDMTVSEMEGKTLLTVHPNNKDKQVRIRSYSYYQSPYDVEVEEKDNQRIKNVKYQKNVESTGQEVAPSNRLVYIKTGGSPDRLNRTPPKMANALTDIENISRAKYDMRKNNHLFGNTKSNFKTETMQEAKALRNKIESTDFQVGKGYAGTAQAYYLEPSGKASEVIIKEIVQGIKNISLITGIPVQFLAYPELLSNRATAENMLEQINAHTIKERTKWEEGIQELIQKAMIIAFEKGWVEANDPNSFIVKIDLTSYANIKQIIEVWHPLQMDDVISMQTLRSLIPSIDPTKEKVLVDDQKEENMKKFQDNVGVEIEEDDSEDEGEEEQEENEE